MVRKCVIYSVHCNLYEFSFTKISKFPTNRIMSCLFSLFDLAMPEFWNNRVILPANYVMIMKPIFLRPKILEYIFQKASFIVHKNGFFFSRIQNLMFKSNNLTNISKKNNASQLEKNNLFHFLHTTFSK